ncbi:MAG: rhomboid family intramembrane serine protease [Bacteroidetes bacterium]|jgi:membrane associated rhomboid family serine protease|nr:rhomboid family intramembrane serine protease [Bacteroidota bacterium]
MNYQRYRPSSQNRMPPGVMNLMIINGIMFLAKILAETKLIDLDILFGLHHPFSPDFHFYQYLTSMFMHANFSHILFNMFGLWIFGVMLENAFGTKRFLIYYLICGFGASIIYQLWGSIAQYNNFVGNVPGIIEALKTYPPGGYLIGASGAVYGVLMGAALLFPNTEMYMMFIPIPVKLKWLAIFYGAMELYSSFNLSPGDNIAHFAHIGGMIFGFILVKIYSRSKTHFY